MEKCRQGPRTLLEAPGITARSKKLLGAPGIATRSKDATRGFPGSDELRREGSFEALPGSGGGD